MNDITGILRQDERAVLCLRRLYERYGYKRYKMNKFEHYDLYLENKSFLTSEKIVTFTDPGGKLLALKPDITLSIVKNAPRETDGVHKVYYCENVYRSGVDSDEIKEIMQVGIELIGRVDLYSEAEVLTLAARSLKEISADCVIGISHMGLITALLDDAGLDTVAREKVSQCIAGKNVHTLRQICSEAGTDAGKTARLAALAAIYGSFDEALPKVKELCFGDGCKDAIAELEGIAKVLLATGESDTFALDFSVTNDMNYYNGITFQGFINGIPRHVLSGGRYDALVRKMGIVGNAVGFAVYPDTLERLAPENKKPDVDVLVVYGKDYDAAELAAKVESITAAGKSVCAVCETAENRPSCKELVEIGGVK